MHCSHHSEISCHEVVHIHTSCEWWSICLMTYDWQQQIGSERTIDKRRLSALFHSISGHLQLGDAFRTLKLSTSISLRRLANAKMTMRRELSVCIGDHPQRFDAFWTPHCFASLLLLFLFVEELPNFYIGLFNQSLKEQVRTRKQVILIIN
jgi:hypothetical protein